jgi:hypothetical protein
MKKMLLVLAMLVAAPVGGASFAGDGRSPEGGALVAQNYPQQQYPGDDDDSWDRQQPPPPPQGENYGYGTANDSTPQPDYVQPYSGQPDPDQPPPPQPQMQSYQQPTDGPTLADFEQDENLRSHGVWIETSEYGRVWQPTPVPQGWQPYELGRWAWTEAGWAWVSEEPFGWATYHYGRWAFIDGAGWVWVPGRVWGPAWVAWRYGEGYAAWCPLGPHGVVYDQPRHWVAVEQSRFLQPVRVNVVPLRQRERVFVAPVLRGPRAGPEPVVVSRVTGQTVRPLIIQDHGVRHTQVNGGTISFFRPRTAPVVAPPRVNVQAPMNRPPGNYTRPIQPVAPARRPAQQPERWEQPRPQHDNGRHEGEREHDRDRDRDHDERK